MKKSIKVALMSMLLLSATAQMQATKGTSEIAIKYTKWALKKVQNNVDWAKWAKSVKNGLSWVIRHWVAKGKMK